MEAHAYELKTTCRNARRDFAGRGSVGRSGPSRTGRPPRHMDVQAQENAGKHHLKKRARAQVSCGRQGVAHSMAARTGTCTMQQYGRASEKRRVSEQEAAHQGIRRRRAPAEGRLQMGAAGA